MTIIEAFKSVRDMPYRIPLVLGEKDVCCSGKHKILKDLFVEQGLTVRYRVCSFLWSSLDLPSDISNVPHDDLSSHVWLEVLIDDNWIIVDATWDISVRNILHVNEWDGKSNTETAVKPLDIFTPQKSADIMNGENDDDILSDLKINGEFYKAFNNWLAENRVSVSE
ncbi:MAG: hypothetical protein IPN70_01120 [Candidatus Moraniibacteriota bacterium]|nr:MAG: hypothetical protein IPN70_01120 [Candidatus Moranbacteria bacterium]